MKDKFSIEDHNSWDKSYGIVADEIYLSVDYDDVNHPEVDAAAKTIVEILNKFWDRELFLKNYKEMLEKQWNEDTHLREEYPDLADYIKDRL
jgi:hypothetical protein